MAQMSLEELYRGEGAGEKYGILGKVMKDFLQNGRPSEYDERTATSPPSSNALVAINGSRNCSNS